MAYIKELFDVNFLEYASYVIKDRAIPYLSDGLKPVQRRILHSLFEMDDGKFNKVANVVGHCMKYHPHGDASIYSALVVLANKDLFIEKQGNFGNIYTGDPASAARYIECRLLAMAREAIYNPELTEYEPSYDGRNKEPVNFPAKFPVSIVHGAEGIAVGMATKIMPHNLIEVLEAMKSELNGEAYILYPDFPTGGLADVTDYNDGQGKLLTRARVEIVNDSTVIIREVPYGCTTESLINSIDNATRANKIMVTKINDFSTDQVEIELKLKRGFRASEIIDALYAFTDCEMSISVNLLLIHENRPLEMKVHQVIEHSTRQLQDILRRELILEQGKLTEKLHRRTLEMIFVKEEIYELIKTRKTLETVKKAVLDGFKPFMAEVVGPITDDDIEHLLRLQIRKISAYDMNKAKGELSEIRGRLAEIVKLLNDIIGYAHSWLDMMIEKYRDSYPRKTELLQLDQKNMKEAAIRDLDFRYNGNNGYAGYDLKDGPKRFKCSIYDRILYIDRKGVYQVIDVPDKKFIGYRLAYVGLTDTATIENTVFTVLYRDKDGVVFIKRFKITKFIANREYQLIPEGGELLELTTETEGRFVVRFVPTKTMRRFEVDCPLDEFAIKGVSARGNKVTDREFSVIEFHKSGGAVVASSVGDENAEPIDAPVLNGLPLFAEPKTPEVTEEEDSE